MKKILGALAVVALFGAFGMQAVAADGHDNCGGVYNAAVEVQQVDLPDNPSGLRAVSYCSDGTLEGAGAPAADGAQPSDCGGGAYPASVEWDTGRLPSGAPIGQAWGCSDSTLDEIQALLP